ncbi:hypothetical protein [Deinococcus yavapaiensis]|uniref:Uncharacterized protein n=1 Tax=Deinococcus yavapaiensis KR-236 TaxID=694435 RepID=A0A318S6I7_9DEIO|nr:hypothetical protein [Deinococcus yavapaiensis]PYE52034.1 hypothetical protein DES52_11380 [Deinococcus yavapaiensis KR-236]
MMTFQVTHHAITRYVERFAGNLSFHAARTRLERLARRARFRHTLPGGARLYTLGEVRFVVAEGVVLTVYRLQYAPLEGTLDLWLEEVA